MTGLLVSRLYPSHQEVPSIEVPFQKRTWGIWSGLLAVYTVFLIVFLSFFPKIFA
jgi:hypothetical protein